MKEQDRREFLCTAAWVGAGVWLGLEAAAQPKPKSANEQINFACVGVGGKGDSDSSDAARFGNVVAICDVDQTILDKKGQQFPKAKKYADYRRMFDEMRGQIDAVTVSTPDHSHAAATARALHHGMHAYTQKPLAHSIYECRALADLARKTKVATQMGIQGHADSSLRRNAYKVRAGALGTVSEVHVWTNRPIWPQGMDRPIPLDVPPNLNWDLWIGPAAPRPYGRGYVPTDWRGYWDFGSGAPGDMACHTMDLPFMALDLRNPVGVSARCTGHNRDSYPRASRIEYEFAATDKRPALKMIWYDGGNLPPKDLIPAGLLPESGDIPSSGSVILGSKGKLYTPGDYGSGGHILDGEDTGTVPFPESPGHWEEFIRAIRGGEPAMANFADYGGALAETVLVGNLAVWIADSGTGEKILWDAQNMRVGNGRELGERLAPIIKPPYRRGYSL